MMDGQCKCGGNWATVPGEQRLVTCDKCDAMMGWVEGTAPPEREPVNREVLRNYLGDWISASEVQQHTREAEWKQTKQTVRNLILGKTVTKVNFNEYGDLLSIEVGNIRLRPTSDADERPDEDDGDWERGDGYWLWIEEGA